MPCDHTRRQLPTPAGQRRWPWLASTMLGSMADIPQSSRASISTSTNTSTNTSTSTRFPSRRLCTHHCTALPLIDPRNQRQPRSFLPRKLPRHGGALRHSSTTVSRSRDASAPAAAAWQILQLRLVESFPNRHACTYLDFTTNSRPTIFAPLSCFFRCSLAFSPLPSWLTLRFFPF